MSKFERLMSVLDEFHTQLGDETNDDMTKLRIGWASAKRDYEEALASKSATKSAIAQGLEQGIRELPQILQKLPEPTRSRANLALIESIKRHAPDIQAKDQERLAKVVQRGRIRSESEYYLVRHQIDLLEGLPAESSRLAVLYKLEGIFNGSVGASTSFLGTQT
jgi:hypothetical protein